LAYIIAAAVGAGLFAAGIAVGMKMIKNWEGWQ